MGRKRTELGLRSDRRTEEPRHVDTGLGILRRRGDRLPWRGPKTATLLAAGLIVLAIVATFSNSFTPPYLR